MGAPPTVVRATSVAGTTRRKKNLIAWSFTLPFIVFFLLFTAIPILSSLGLSFTDLKIGDIRNPFDVELIGLENYTALLSDEQFLQAVRNTAYFVVVGVPLTMATSLAAAVGLNQQIIKFRSVFRVGYYLPVVTSIVAIAVVWRLLLNPDTGLVNGVLGSLGIEGPGWLTDPALAMPSIIVMATWRNMGFLMVIFLAGLQAIPRMLYDAAEIDGAGVWTKFRFVTLPMLRPTMLFAAVITTIGYLQFFEEPFVMTQGGPLDKTLSVSMHVYSQFSFGNYGYAAAMSYLLFIAIAIFTLIQFRVLGKDLTK